MALTNVINQLKNELKTHTREMGRINNAISLLQGRVAAAKNSAHTRRKMSAATIEKIRAAQKARWAAVKKKTPTKK